MPIYMDRHDVSENVTAENVAELHQQDLKIQDRFGCRGLTYWFDEKRKTAFCLIEAPDEKTLQEMHNQAHGQVPHSIIEVDASIVESFLGRIEDPVKAKNTALNIINDPAFRTIMVMELYDPAFPNKDLTALKTILEKFNNAIPDILQSYEGKIVKQGGNHYLVSFHAVSKAVHAAIDLHALFKHFTKDIQHENFYLKTGLSAGIPVTDKKIIFEDCIKLADRMCQFINGKIIISAEVKDLYNSENLKALVNDKNITLLSPADEKFLTLLMDYTEKNLGDDNLKADNFCKPLGCSKSQLYRKMLLLTGHPLKTFLNDYRLTAALRLLKKNAGNISEIAFETGFSSPSYFSKCFQKKFGHTPSDYLAATVRQPSTSL